MLFAASAVTDAGATAISAARAGIPAAAATRAILTRHKYHLLSLFLSKPFSLVGTGEILLVLSDTVKLKIPHHFSKVVGDCGLSLAGDYCCLVELKGAVQLPLTSDLYSSVKALGVAAAISK